MGRDHLYLSSLVLADILEEHEAVSCMVRCLRNQTCFKTTDTSTLLLFENLTPLVWQFGKTKLSEFKAEDQLKSLVHLKSFLFSLNWVGYK